MPETLESIMQELRSRVNTADETTTVEQSEIEALKKDTVVVMPAGGRGTRIRGETASEEINKVMISVEGESMIKRTIQDYSAVGIDKFVVLTGFLADAVEEHLGDGSQWGVDIKYSKDPGGKKVGNAGAILHALNNGTLDDRLTSIVHNPDDMIIGMTQPYAELFLEGQVKAKKSGCIATFVVVPETPFQYSGMIIDRGRVVDVTKYPPITIPAHTGITIFDPEVYGYFRNLVSLEEESSFEKVVCPVIADEGRLYAINIPSNTWVPVNNLKGLERAEEAIEITNKSS
jgi:NDP-sugar pyrophosphorylase family protein